MAKAKSKKIIGPLMSEEKASRAADIWMFITTATLLSIAVTAIEDELSSGCDQEQIELLCRYFGCDEATLAYRILACTELGQRWLLTGHG